MERKRKVTFITDIEFDRSAKKQKKLTYGSRNTCSDSDDEEQNNSKAMNQDDLNGEIKKIIEENFRSFLEIGQGQGTIGFDDDDDGKVTGFNVDEEMEEGHYDQTGCFQWKINNVHRN